MTRDVFKQVYMGELHPRTAVLTGRVKVDSFAFGDMYRFATAFDLSSEEWARCEFVGVMWITDKII
mgnify:CR=1 FL=1